MLHNSPFVGEALAGSWRESDLLASARRRSSPAPRTHDGIIVTPRPDEMWEIDSHAFQDELRFVGIRSSPLFIRSPGATDALNDPFEHSRSNCSGSHTIRNRRRTRCCASRLCASIQQSLNHLASWLQDIRAAPTQFPRGE